MRDGKKKKKKMSTAGGMQTSKTTPGKGKRPDRKKLEGMGKSSNSLISKTKGLERKGTKRKTSSDLPVYKSKDKLPPKNTSKT